MNPSAKLNTYNLNKYLRFQAKCALRFYSAIMYYTDKRFFALLFNLKCTLMGSTARLKWKERWFLVEDKELPKIALAIRNRFVCDSSYQNGLLKRVVALKDCYFLDKVDFKDGDVFLDCGANVGDLKLCLDINKKNISYIGFEPSPIEFECLKRNVAPCEVHRVGLWNKTGKLDFFLSSDGADSSLIQPKHYDNIVTSNVLRLEDFITKPIKCLKLEAEGGELEILFGIGDKLNFIEFITADLGYERGIDEESTFVPATNFLLSHGFELIDFGYPRICALYHNKNFKK